MSFKVFITQLQVIFGKEVLIVRFSTNWEKKAIVRDLLAEDGTWEDYNAPIDQAWLTRHQVQTKKQDGGLYLFPILSTCPIAIYAQKMPDTSVLRQLQELLLLNVLYEIDTRLERIIASHYKEDLQLIHRFAMVVGRYLPITKIVTHQDEILLTIEDINRYTDALSIKYENKEIIQFHLAQFIDIQKDISINSQLLLSSWLSKSFKRLYQKWLNKDTASVESKDFNDIQNSIHKYQHLLRKVVDFQSVLEGKLFTLIPGQPEHQAEPSSEYEFYRLSSGWMIRFEGKVVDLNNRNEKGLSYVHKLLCAPQQEIYCNILEGIQLREDEDTVHLQLNEHFSLRYDQGTFEKFSEDKDGLLSRMKQVTLNRPDEALDKPETFIYYFAELLYILELLKRIEHKSLYFKLQKEYQSELSNYMNSLKLEKSEEYVQKVMTKTKIIQRPYDFQKEKRRLRQRVTVSIKNALESIDSKKLSDHFEEMLRVGNPSIYKDNSINWKLFVD